MENKSSAIIEKIKKLFAKANDASVTEEEALAYMNKAQELLATHNLDMSSLREEDEVSTMDKTVIETSYGHIRWRASLLVAISKLFFCKGYIHNTLNKKGKPTKKFVIAGKEHNRAIASSMLDYLEKTVVRLSLNFSSDANERYHFEKGCGMRLAVRINDKIKEMNNAQNNGEKSNLPALYSQELALVDDFLSDINFKNGQNRRVYFNDAANAGAKAANNISLNNQLGGNKNSHSYISSKANKFLLA
jgi:hypothetical protein